MTINDSVDDPPQHLTRLRRGGGMLNHAVYGELRKRLLNGCYAAGARLSTEEPRTEFGVSKQPVMEALRRLSADGMVEIVPQVGSLVAIHEPREADDFYLMFSGFEGAIAGIAAQRRTDIQLAELDLISAAHRCAAQPAGRCRPITQLSRAEPVLPPRHP